MSQNDAETRKNGVEDGIQAAVKYYEQGVLAVLKQTFDSVSPDTMHNIMHPSCPQCAAERFLTRQTAVVTSVSLQNEPS